MTQVFELRVGNTSKVVTVQLQYTDNTGLVNRILTGLSVTFSMRNKKTGELKVVNQPATVVTAADGIVSYDFETVDVDTPGIYLASFTVTESAETDVYPVSPVDLEVWIHGNTLTAQQVYSTNFTDIVDFPKEITIGDSYSASVGYIKLEITNSSGLPITSLGSLDFADADIDFTAFRPNDSATITGTCVFVSSASESYVKLYLTSTATSLGKAGYTYEGRLRFIWEGVSSGTHDDEQKTYKTTPFKFIANP